MQFGTKDKSRVQKLNLKLKFQQNLKKCREIDEKLAKGTFERKQLDKIHVNGENEVELSNISKDEDNESVLIRKKMLTVFNYSSDSDTE